MAGGELKRRLTLFDLTNIIVGSVVGAEIYVVPAITAGLVGPFSIVVWIVAGIFATVIALVLAYCSFYVPKVGGPYAYVTAAFDNFYGFLTGWSMWIAEMMALPVFAIVFVKYLVFFIPLNAWEDLLVKALFIGGLTYVNIIGVKIAGWATDILTILKLAPLLILTIVGAAIALLHPAMLLNNYQPFTPLGFGQVGPAIALVFWAYLGFEMGTLPASEVEEPAITIPKAITLGMFIAVLIYLFINFIIYGVVNWTTLASSPTPLILAGAALLGSAGALLMTLGALTAVTGSNEPFMLGISRLSYALSVDGLFPQFFSRVHPSYDTPYVSLIIQGVIAFALSTVASFPQLITFSVFNFAFLFLLVCLSLIILQRDHGTHRTVRGIIPYVGIGICIYLLLSSTPLDIIAGTAVILLGIPVYLYFAPKKCKEKLKDELACEGKVFARSLETEEGLFVRSARRLQRTGNNVKKRKE